MIQICYRRKRIYLQNKDNLNLCHSELFFRSTPDRIFFKCPSTLYGTLNYTIKSTTCPTNYKTSYGYVEGIIKQLWLLEGGA